MKNLREFGAILALAGSVASCDEGKKEQVPPPDLRATAETAALDELPRDFEEAQARILRFLKEFCGGILDG